MQFWQFSGFDMYCEMFKQGLDFSEPQINYITNDSYCSETPINHLDSFICIKTQIVVLILMTKGGFLEGGFFSP